VRLAYVFILLLCAAQANAAELKIATWNIAWLNATDGKGQIARSQADYDRLAGYVQKLDADIIALEEVQGEAAARRVFDPTTYSFHFEARRDDQMVGFAIKKTVTYKANPDLDELNVSGGLRRGADITVAANGKELRLLAVHLKSGCWDFELTNPKKDCQSLNRQVPILENWIDDRAKAGQAFIVLGDFNRRFDAPGDKFWPEIDDGDPNGLKLHRLTAGLKAECWNSHYPRFIDHIIADAKAFTYLVPKSFQQLVYGEKTEDKRLSDHCPISARFRL